MRSFAVISLKFVLGIHTDCPRINRLETVSMKPKIGKQTPDTKSFIRLGDVK
ncbi:hypothetical protein HMPREF1210_02350 [Paenisporosarcina sp. HGH0030]|nr:hypothetical protein HMPREF1210_02350 [Paenisporosarcina sp. HGH0030]